MRELVRRVHVDEAAAVRRGRTRFLAAVEPRVETVEHIHHAHASMLDELARRIEACILSIDGMERLEPETRHGNHRILAFGVKRRRLGDDEKDYFLGLPPTGQPDTRTAPEQGAVK